MNLTVENLAIDSLIPYAKNSRTHSSEQIAQVADSIKSFGWTNPVLIDEAGGIIAGHGRVMAAKTLDISVIPCIRLSHLTEAQKRAYVIADNKLALNAGWNEDLLAEELMALRDSGLDLGLTGFSDKELEKMLGVEEPVMLTEPDEVPPVPENPKSVRGDIWVLGNHRVMCGSSTEFSDLDILMQSKKADMVFTDPPYLMNFTGAIDGQGNTRSKHDAIANDNLSKSEGEKFLREVSASIRMYCNGAWYVCFYRLGIDWMMNALTDAGLKWRNLIIWKKNQLNLSNSDYKSIYEPIIYGWASDYEPMLYGWNLVHEFHGSKGEIDVMDIVVPSVWEIARTKNNDLHPTMKPVELCERAILNSSVRGGGVLDLFGGSGSTLIAAEKTGRIARLMELEPKYVDVIVRRWQDFTGKQAVHEQTGKPF